MTTKLLLVLTALAGALCSIPVHAQDQDQERLLKFGRHQTAVLNAIAACLDKKLTDKGVELLMSYRLEATPLAWQVYQDGVKAQGKPACSAEYSSKQYRDECYYPRMPVQFLGNTERWPVVDIVVANIPLVRVAVEECGPPATEGLGSMSPANMMVLAPKLMTVPRFRKVGLEQDKRITEILRSAVEEQAAIDKKKRANFSPYLK